MRGFTIELLIALFIGAVMLARFLYAQLRRRALLMQAQNAPPVEARSAAVPPATQRIPIPDTQTKALRREALPTAASAQPVCAAAHVRRSAGRFSRQVLIPDRRAIHNALVIATILNPCHARRPHEIE